ncbi:hypothetical protein [Halobacillus halophilus]|uniref:hypothetical protein n=1 Tax=Halobacillus halophilus TaxID=1570 RepID=UPI001CD38008|nr:hypothetical protein [Halobacillus halophilus]MCA1011362.1 hypothetical protein [Halobacillus halophilus]
MMRLMFILAALAMPVSLLLDQAAAGILISLFFLFAGAFFSKPRFNRYKRS